MSDNLVQNLSDAEIVDSPYPASKPRLVLVRGLPGSGKSTKAKAIVKSWQEKYPDVRICHFETDMYFVNQAGHYQFDGTKIPQAHAWCQRQVATALTQNAWVIVSNTFVEKWEMKAYLKLAKKHHISTQIIVCKGEYQNIHQVPEAVISRMRKKWQNE